LREVRGGKYLDLREGLRRGGGKYLDLREGLRRGLRKFRAYGELKI